jgi:hypothetical protein
MRCCNGLQRASSSCSKSKAATCRSDSKATDIKLLRESAVTVLLHQATRRAKH